MMQHALSTPEQREQARRDRITDIRSTLKDLLAKRSAEIELASERWKLSTTADHDAWNKVENASIHERYAPMIDQYERWLHRELQTVWNHKIGMCEVKSGEVNRDQLYDDDYFGPVTMVKEG